MSGFNHFVRCVASYEGGAIYSYAATASLNGNNTFKSNTATTGRGLHARWSNVRITERSKFEKVVGFTLTTAPLNSLTPAFSEVIRLTILVVVYMLQKVF